MFSNGIKVSLFATEQMIYKNSDQFLSCSADKRQRFRSSSPTNVVLYPILSLFLRSIEATLKYMRSTLLRFDG